MDICSANKSVSLEVKNFMANVKYIKEESITDFLVWKWNELDARFKYLNVDAHNRKKESKTGADFELELWLVGRRFHVSLVFQAKKFVKDHDQYVQKLSYPKGTKDQLNKLLSFAKKNKKLPFYMIYSLPDSNTKTMCKGLETDTALFMADAYTIKKIADGSLGKKISKNDILKHTNPFHCLFCCPLCLSINSCSHYFSRYFPSLSENGEVQSNETLPSYVASILHGGMQELRKDEIMSIIDENGLRSFRAIGVYDCSDLDLYDF